MEVMSDAALSGLLRPRTIARCSQQSALGSRQSGRNDTMSTVERRVDHSGVHEFTHVDWLASRTRPPRDHRALARLLEDGAVLSFPRLAFDLGRDEQRRLHVGRADGRAKNISLRWPRDGSPPRLRGAVGAAHDLAALQALLVRFSHQSATLVSHLFPQYAPHLQRGNTSYRPWSIAGRLTSWRQDDTRLHVDAFPSSPTGGRRLLRVFTNVNPLGQPRIWRTGECFEDFARRFLPRIGRPFPGASQLLHALRITKARRTEYDHVMLRLHDLAKADLHYQREAPQQLWGFAPGTTWICFSDQVLHAAMSGQYLFEQTFLLEPQFLLQPERSPLHVLERLLKRRLVDPADTQGKAPDLEPVALPAHDPDWADELRIRP
jgi:hypothetical protein